MKAGIGATVAGFFLPYRISSAWAKEYSALGTFPAGTNGSTIFIGGVMPLTGPYSSSGKDMQLGFELAIDHLNNAAVSPSGF
jgi:ABC-type branched-subunit amino acid transport system substrate-binding protein